MTAESRGVSDTPFQPEQARCAAPHWIVIMSALLLLVRPVDAQQQLGHKLLAGVGVDAGAQPEPGLYMLDRFAYFGADHVNDQSGHGLPIQGLNIDVYGNVLGLAL